MGSLSISDVIKTISDDKSLALFNTVALASGDTDSLKTILKLTRRQYYSRMSALVDAGLVIRKSGRYFLTSFGRIVYEAQKIIGKAIETYWKLKAIDSFQMSSPSAHLSTEEYTRIINTLLEGKDELRDILLRENNNFGPSQKQKSLDRQELTAIGLRA